MQGAIENLGANRNPHLTKWKQNNTVFWNDCFRHFISVMFPLFSLYADRILLFGFHQYCFLWLVSLINSPRLVNCFLHFIRRESWLGKLVLHSFLVHSAFRSGSNTLATESLNSLLESRCSYIKRKAHLIAFWFTQLPKPLQLITSPF